MPALLLRQLFVGVSILSLAVLCHSSLVASDSKDPSSEKMTLQGGTEGTSFESLVIEGEDRVQVQFPRPALDLQLDPRNAMRFDFGDAHEVVQRHAPDTQMPFLRQSALQRSAYLGRPWMEDLATTPVARFAPAIDNVAQWRLVIADSRSETVRTFEGRGKPPATVEWDGRATDGTPALPGLTYSYSLEAHDRAGNKRTFVGDGFNVPSYRLHEDGVLVLVVAGEHLVQSDAAVTDASPGVLLDAASWINQQSLDDMVHVRATARTYETADALGAFVKRHLERHTLGPATRVAVQADVLPTAPASGAVMVTVGAPAPRSAH